METLVFYVKGQIITPQYNNIVLAEKSVGYLKANFIFEKDWDNLQKVAIFEQNKKQYFYLIPDNGEDFFIPSEVIKVPGFKVSVFGSDTAVTIDGNGKLKDSIIKKRITTSPVGISLRIAVPMEGEIPSKEDEELSVAENATLALKIAKEAYTLFWNIEESLDEIYNQLGGDREKELLEKGSL